MHRVSPALAAAKLIDRHGAEHVLSEAWRDRTAVLVFLRHFG